MSNILSKKHLGFILGAVMALSIGMIALSGISDASATGLTADQMYGGSTATGAAFATNAGLGNASLITTIAQVIKVALGFLGIIAVVMILYGGFKWMTAAGTDERVKDAKKIIYAGIIGLVIILTSFAVASFILSSIVTATTASV